MARGSGFIDTFSSAFSENYKTSRRDKYLADREQALFEKKIAEEKLLKKMQLEQEQEILKQKASAEEQLANIKQSGQERLVSLKEDIRFKKIAENLKQFDSIVNNVSKMTTNQKIDSVLKENVDRQGQNAFGQIGRAVIANGGDLKDAILAENASFELKNKESEETKRKNALNLEIIKRGYPPLEIKDENFFNKAAELFTKRQKSAKLSQEETLSLTKSEAIIRTGEELKRLFKNPPKGSASPILKQDQNVKEKISTAFNQARIDSGAPLLTADNQYYQDIQKLINDLKRYTSFSEGGKTLTDNEKQIIWAPLNLLGKTEKTEEDSINEVIRLHKEISDRYDQSIAPQDKEMNLENIFEGLE